MKYKLMGLAALLLVSAAAFAAGFFDDEGKAHLRYHQHLEEPGYVPCEDHGDEVFCSHLPLVVIDTQGQEIPGVPIGGKMDRFGESIYTQTEDGEDFINIKVSVIDNDEGNNHLTDTPDFTTRSFFRVRGHSSREFEKAPYLLKFVDENGLDNKLSVMGMEAHNEWALHGPYLDKSLVRNYMWYNISGELMDWAPNARYCELFLNGDYRGLYLMVETIANGDTGRLNLVETYKGTNINGYLLRIDRPTEADLASTRDIYSFLERENKSIEDISIRYPGKNTLTPELAREIELDFAEYEKCLYSFDYDTENYAYWNWIDEDNYIDYLLVNELTRNVDAGRYSTYIYKEPGEKLKMCVWDFNNACDNYKENVFSEAGFTIQEQQFFYMLLKDEAFAQKVIDRYRELRKTYFSDEYMMNYIDDTIRWLGPAVQRNSERWSDAYTEYEPLKPLSRNVHSLDEAVNQLKTWLCRRAGWLDKNIDAVSSFAHPSRNKEYNH